MSASGATTTVLAWRLELGSGCSVAVGGRELLHLIERPRLRPAPEQPPYARWRLHWRDMVVPVVDLPALLAGTAACGAPALIGVFAYRAADGLAHSAGGLSLEALPARLRVGDEQACALPSRLANWAPLTLSCFEHAGEVLPVVDLVAMFSRLLLPAQAAG